MKIRWILSFYISTLYITLCISQAVLWKVVTPVGLGCDVQLFCNVSGVDECCTNNRRWSRTVDSQDNKHKPFMINGVSSYPDKFIEDIKPNGFNLIIKNLNQSDIDVFYKCSYGFYSSESKQIPAYLNNSVCTTNTGSEKKTFYISSIPTLASLIATILLF